MSSQQPRRTSALVRAAKKFFVSGFVIFTFTAYAIHERLTTQDAIGAVPTATVATPVLPTAAQQALATPQPPTLPPAPATQPPSTAAAPTVQPPTLPPAPATQPPTAAAAPAQPQLPPAAASAGRYKDGQYAGSIVDAYYGLVKVQATIQNGSITAVNFLEYPDDRRTSIRINRVAMPMLTSEAIQAQSADVDIISGATLTSEAFSLSLQSALQSAKA